MLLIDDIVNCFPKNLVNNYVFGGLFRNVSMSCVRDSVFLCRPSVSRDCGTLHLHSQILLIIFLSVLGGITCGALALMVSSLLHLYRVSDLSILHQAISYLLHIKMLVLIRGDPRL